MLELFSRVNRIQLGKEEETGWCLGFGVPGTGYCILQRPEGERNKKGEQVSAAVRRFWHCVWRGRKDSGLINLFPLKV